MTEELDFTRHSIERRTGFRLAVTFPTWETDGAGVISFHDELERLGNDLYWTNVIGIFIDEGKLALGVFVKTDMVIDVEPVAHELPGPYQLPAGE
ncbi:MAG: hypothetical protein ACREGC_04065 [Minisyncoccia bacterium]